MLKGMNILYGTGLYVAAIWALYMGKKVTFKDQKEIDALPNIAIRKATKDKQGYQRARAGKFAAFTKGKRFEGEDTKDWTEFQREFEKKQWVR